MAMWGSLATARTSPNRVPDGLSVLLIVVLAVVVTHNAFRYSPVSGFDAEDAIRYASRLVEQWRIPTELRNYYTPPGFFLLAGWLVQLGGAVGVSEPLQLPQLLNGVLTVGTAVLLAGLCAIVFPGRAWLRFTAIAFFVSAPIVLKVAAMFHPQPLVAFLSTLALVLAAQMLRDRRYGLGAALALGLVVGAGQLVRSVGVWTLVSCAWRCLLPRSHESRNGALRCARSLSSGWWGYSSPCRGTCISRPGTRAPSSAGGCLQARARCLALCRDALRLRRPSGSSQWCRLRRNGSGFTSIRDCLR